MKNKNICINRLFEKLFVLIFFLSFSFTIVTLSSVEACAQNANVGVNITGKPTNDKAMLDVDATGMNPKAGFLITRMTSAERNTITSPIPESLLIYNTDIHCFEANYNGNWIAFGCLSSCPVLSQPTANSYIPSQTQIIWKWNSVSGATGYQWNTSSIYPGTGKNIVSGPTLTQTGLNCNTSYALYVWANNPCGNSSFATLTQNTSGCICGITYSGSGNIGTVAGNGISGYSGDGDQALCAQVNAPGVGVDISGNVYVVDYGNNRIRKVNFSTGIITTVAGNGNQGYNGDGIAATDAELWSPNGVAVDGSGNIYIADYLNNRVRKVTASTGIISTIAGNGTAGYNSDGIAATAAELNAPLGLAVDASGNIYIADYYNIAIRKVTVSTGIISTIAGKPGWFGYTGDNGPATAAELEDPEGVAVDGAGNVYISDWRTDAIRKVTASTGIITTIAGNGTSGFSGDGGIATNATLDYPLGVAADASGNIYIGDRNNNRIRKVTASTGIISTIAGNGSQGYNNDGIPATNAKLNYPVGVAVDLFGNVYIGDAFNYRIRKICK